MEMVYLSYNFSSFLQGSALSYIIYGYLPHHKYGLSTIFYISTISTVILPTYTCFDITCVLVKLNIFFFVEKQILMV